MLRRGFILAFVVCGASAVLAGEPIISKTAQIAFASEFGGDLYLMDAQTLATRRMHLDVRGIADLTYSPTRRLLAFDGYRKNDNRRSLFVLSWPGTRPERIATLIDSPYRPKFDPDGKYVYAVNYGPAILRYSLEVHHWDRIPVKGVDGVHVQGLSFSPSGHLATISPAAFVGFLITAVEPGQFRVIRSVLSNFEECISARWIDEDHIVFLGRKMPGYQFLWELNLQTGGVRQLTHLPLGTRDYMSLSKDSKTVVVTANDKNVPPEWTVWRLHLDNPKPIKLIHGIQDDSFLFPTWIE